MSLATAAGITLLAPLVGCLLIALTGMRIPPRAAAWLGCAALLVAFVGAVGAAMATPVSGDAALLTPYTWLQAGSFDVGLDLYVDRLAIFMMLVVTGVGFLIHVYSVGYMAHDPAMRRFFAYLNIFVFAMLMLVMAGNVVMLLVGWGLVGMASYLLIGFWHERPTAVAAAKKAFVINAIGDVAIMLGVFVAFKETGVLDYVQLGEALHADASVATMTWISMLLLGGAVAKSAQLPLQTWLPDAMEGPTPVSALIHAATMVTAGVYLVARMAPITFTQWSMAATALIGALTLTMAGLIALAQTDIKRVIAYSTMSQIGYMFVGVGVGATTAGMFHLYTHAFFKALLFLGAGIVIHALADEQDIRKMGGLRRHMPRTYALFLIGSLALAGIFPFAGFFSKDAILGEAFHRDWSYGAYTSQWWDVLHWSIWGLGIAGVLVTGLYAFRLLFVVFHGEESELVRQYGAGELAHHAHGGEEHHEAHHHTPGTSTAPTSEGPMTMMLPVWILGIGVCIGGLLWIPGVGNAVASFLHAGGAELAGPLPEESEIAASTEWALALLVSLPLAALGIFTAWRIWGSGRWASLRTRFPRLERAGQRAFGWDALYDRAFSRPVEGVAAGIADVVEVEIIPSTTTGPAWAARVVSGAIGSVHNGMVRIYAIGTVIAMTVVVVAVVWLGA